MTLSGWACLPVLVLVAGCTSAGAAPRAAGSGHYAVATPEAARGSVPVASAGHYQLVSAGDAVRVELGSAVVRAQMTGPALDTTGQAPLASAPGVVTVLLTAERGALTVPASSFLTLGQHQDRVAVHADRPVLRVSPGHPATLHLSTRFTAGHTTLTWQPAGSPLVTWDFVIELD